MYTIDRKNAYYIEELEYFILLVYTNVYIYIYTHSYLVYNLSLCSARKSITLSNRVRHNIT